MYSRPDSPFPFSAGGTGDRGRLTFPYYYAQVVGTSVDPNRSGSVQARVAGVTDKWQDKDQPWFAPQLTAGMQQVPQKGHWLLVRFIDGDINQGMYYGVSQTKEFLPSQYVSQYPDVAALNMGETDYVYIHNRRSHVTTVTNPGNNSSWTWNAAGEISVESGNSSDEAGSAPLPVLTEGTIDIFTCMPVGAADNGVRAGSEYLRVPHISKSTIDALRGNAGGTVDTVQSVKDSENDGENTREISGTEKTYSVPFMESPAAKRRSGKKYLRIVIAATGKSPLAEFLSNYTDDNAKNCAHYLVGVADGDPDILSLLDDKTKAANRGFIQCAELSMDCTLGSDMRGKPNIDAVGVMFYGDGNLNKYQQGKLNDIVHHVKETGKVDEVEVVAYRPPSPLDTRYFTYFNLKNLEGAY